MERRDLASHWGNPVPDDSTGGVHAQAAWRKGEDSFSATCYAGTVPAFVETALAALYGSLYSSLPLLRVYDSLQPGTSTWVLQRNGHNDAIFLFRLHKGVATVLNEGMKVHADQVRAFCHHVFALYPGLQVVRFSSVQWQQGEGPGYPCQHHPCLENIVLPLPSTVTAYHGSLSKNLRRNLKRYGERLQRDFPDYRYRVLEGSQASEAEVRAIIALNIARMNSKNKTSAYDEAETERMVQLVRQAGLVGVATIDGRVCSGGIAIRTGDNYALSVLSHDPAYNDYSMGILSAYQMICACIERRAIEFQFLWGRYDYKYLLGASDRELEKLAVYRSWLHVLRHSPTWVQHEADAVHRHVIERLQHLAKQETRSARWAMAALRGLRALRHAWKISNVTGLPK